MGRVKTKNIKRTGEELIREYPDEFSENFAENKKKVDELTTVQSKSVRNKIAGYTVALKKRVVD
jgi:small subunit ribosomal protein S17e